MLEFEGGVVAAPHAGAMAMKLTQLVSGFLYGSEGKHRVSSERYELATELVSERKHSLIAFLFKEQRDHMKELLDAAGIKYAVLDGDTPSKRFAEIVDEYQRGMHRCQPSRRTALLASRHNRVADAPLSSISCSSMPALITDEASERGHYDPSRHLRGWPKALMAKNASQLIYYLLKETMQTNIVHHAAIRTTQANWRTRRAIKVEFNLTSIDKILTKETMLVHCHDIA